MPGTEGPLELRFWRARETANFVVYEEETRRHEKPLVGSLYLRKQVSAEWGDPERLAVTIQPA